MRRLYLLLCIVALLFGCTGGVEPDDNTGGIVPDENTGGGDNGGEGEGTGNEGDNGEDSGDEGGGKGDDSGEGGGNGDGGNGNEGNGNEDNPGGEVTMSFSDIEGTWMLEKWQGTTPSFSVYMEIGPDGAIILWQKIDDYVWERYDSTAALDSNVISGTYSDNVSWSSSYSIEFEGEDMVWTGTEDESDVSVYVRADLPDNL